MSKAVTLLFAHGGGFCKETWEPIIRRLQDSTVLQAVNAQFVSFDFKYHGSNRDEAVAANVDLENPAGPRVHHPAAETTAWTTAQVLQQTRAVRSKSSDFSLIGIGHSMGASAMWNVEAQYPGTFDGLILFEPVYGNRNIDDITTFLVSITLKRESSWPSRAAAEAHLRHFKNFAAWDRESLEAYMKGALLQDKATGKTVLACNPLIEASLYCHKLLHLTDHQLVQPKCKIFFHYGSRTKAFLPSILQTISAQWPHIYTMETPIANASHAMVLEKPAEAAHKILDNLQELPPWREAMAPNAASTARLHVRNPMDTLLATAVTLRSFLQRAAENLKLTQDDVTLDQNLSSVINHDIAFALDHTFLSQGIPAEGQAYPRRPWNCDTELIHHVIERLLVRKRSMQWEDANILTLGYREVTPDAAGHRVTQSNGIMCYYPNTLVAVLKKPLWESLHRLIGDDLMTHLLLNYTIFVQVKETSVSYMQIAGTSLRQQTRHALASAVDSVNREVSINRVMYARFFRKDRVFATSHVLVKASKTGNPISRTEASRVLRSIFASAAGKKRLPKRLINLIPAVQFMVSRFKACRIKELATKLTPLNAGFRKFMADNPNIIRIIAARAAHVTASSNSILFPIVRKSLDDGYLTQGEVGVPSSDRKRKRREEAIENLSCASARSVKLGKGKSLSAKKKQKRTDISNGNEHEAHQPADLIKFQQHTKDVKELLAFATPKKKIYRLVRKFVARIVPKELWGNSDTKTNWTCVKMLLRKLIFSRKFDAFSLKKCVDELQVTKVEWMKVQKNAKFCPPNERIKRHKLFQDLLWWVLQLLVFPLLRNLFYITDAEGMANEITYYQRPVWNVISTLALDDLEGDILQPLDNQTASTNHEQCLLSTSRLRLLPKASGVRPLMNLSTAVDRTTVSVNRSMESVHRVLTFEMERQPKRLLGASVRSIDEIYKRLKPLFRRISSCRCCTERRRASAGDIPMAYCVTVDVERCFDTIRPRKVYQIAKKAIREDEYLIRKHWVGHQVTAMSSSTESGTSPPQSSFFFKLERPAYPSGEFLGFDELAAQSSKKSSMFVDGVLYDYLTKTKALELLKEHLSANRIVIDGHDYVQRCGIPQGSVLSTTLCNMYYAHFERRVLRKHLPEVCDPAIGPLSCCQHEELFRYTDDFMYITTDLKRARRFFEVMHGGNQEYGCFINPSKSQANFEIATARGQSMESATSSGISWCGMLIDPNQLQIHVNYEKLSSSLLQGSIPFNETKAARNFFVKKAVSPIHQRWHALYFDPELLSEDTIHVNLFQTLIVAAHRFTVLVEMLPFVNRNMRFFHECIHRILKKMVKAIHRSLQLGFAGSSLEKTSRSYSAQKHHVWAIGLHAFELTIHAKQNQVDAKQQVYWHQLLETVRSEQEEFKQRTKKNQGVGRRSAHDLNWLLHDYRNASVLKQFLQLDVDSL